MTQSEYEEFRRDLDRRERCGSIAAVGLLAVMVIAVILAVVGIKTGNHWMLFSGTGIVLLCGCLPQILGLIENWPWVKR